jgi:hypothetical protein
MDDLGADREVIWPIVKRFADYDLTDLRATGTRGHVFGKTANLAYCVAPNHLKWEASFQECQPNALGPLGTLDGTLAGILGMKRTHKPRALDPLGSLEPSGLPI